MKYLVRCDGVAKMCPDGFISWLATIFFSRALEIRSVVIVCIEHHSHLTMDYSTIAKKYRHVIWFNGAKITTIYNHSYFQFFRTSHQYLLLKYKL